MLAILQPERLPVYFGINIEEKNSDSYLSAGEMPLILKKNGTEQVFRIHGIIAAQMFLKSLSLVFHGVNHTKIAANGIHEESWAILYYVTHLLKAGGSLQPERLPVYFGINIEGKNSDSHLSAGEMPLPALPDASGCSSSRRTEQSKCSGPTGS